MSIQPVPAAPATVPFPGLNEKAAGTYNAAAFAWGNQMPAYAEGLKALGDNVFNNATEAKTSADTAATKASESVAAADIAVIAAQTAVNSPGSMATSTTSLALSSGDKVLVLAEADKDFAVGQFLVVSSVASPTVNYMTGRVKAYDKPGKSLTMGDITPNGAGTHADWSIAVGVGPSNVPRVAYDNRATLRTMTPVQSASVVVSGLGLFTFDQGSNEIDDDETCFATGTGRWLLEAASMDVVDGWFKFQLDQLLSMPVTLFGSARSLLTSVGAAQNVVAATAVCYGASVGDRVLVTPPGPLQYGAGCWGAVTAPDLVTVYINNPSAGNAATNVAGIFRFVVFKESV